MSGAEVRSLDVRPVRHTHSFGPQSWPNAGLAGSDFRDLEFDYGCSS
jgi:hypothetical protein